MTGAARAGAILLGFVALWQAICAATGAPSYILPAPMEVLQAGISRSAELTHHASVTLIEILLGLTFGTAAGLAIAHIMMVWRWTREWLMPLSIASQAIPVFALAPILVLWLGYGLASKVAMTALIVFFPVTAAAFDGLRRTPKDMLDAIHAMTHGNPGAASRILWRVRWPMALPVLAPGLKTAAAISPIGAVIGEWVGASEGLGHAMLKANSRAEIDMMFACAAVLMTIGVGLYLLADWGLRRLAPWAAAKPGDESE
jgi:putative hydroxymethylpyrimidine transport system permease protein